MLSFAELNLFYIFDPLKLREFVGQLQGAPRATMSSRIRLRRFSPICLYWYARESSEMRVLKANRIFCGAKALTSAQDVFLVPLLRRHCIYCPFFELFVTCVFFDIFCKICNSLQYVNIMFAICLHFKTIFAIFYAFFATFLQDFH